VATLWPELQQACFAIWKRKFARLRTTDEVVKELNALLPDSAEEVVMGRAASAAG